LASGALAIVVVDGGIVLLAELIVPAAARFADDGGAAGCNSAGETACGVDCAEGKTGAAERAVSDVSSGAFSRFHHARRGPDWQPIIAAETAAIVNARRNLIFIGASPRACKLAE
jgi:hypothetical protein